MTLVLVAAVAVHTYSFLNNIYRTAYSIKLKHYGHVEGDIELTKRLYVLASTTDTANTKDKVISAKLPGRVERDA